MPSPAFWRGKVATVIRAAHDVTQGDGLRVAADEEALPFADASLDLVVSALALQFVNDLPGTLIQIRRALKPDGLLLAALIGGDILERIARRLCASRKRDRRRRVSPRVAPFADLRELGALMQRAGFALPVIDSDRLTVRYDNRLRADARSAPHGRDQRACRAPARAAQARDLARMAEIYCERFADADGRLRASFEIVWLSGWAPHESQQTAAQARLGQAAACRCARRQGAAGRRKGGALIKRSSITPALRSMDFRFRSGRPGMTD